MRFGIVGLGSMGGNLALQALEKGHEVMGFSRSEKPEITQAGVEIAGSPEQLVERLSAPRVVLLTPTLRLEWVNHLRRR